MKAVWGLWDLPVFGLTSVPEDEGEAAALLEL